MDPSYNSFSNGIDPNKINTGMQAGGMNTTGFGGGGSNNNMPMSTGGGDVILKPEPKKNNKVLFMVLGFLVIAAIVAVIVVVIINATKGSMVSSENNKAAFDRFANYIISGSEDGDFPDVEYDRNAIYPIERALEEHDEAYFENANRLFDGFLDSIDLESDDFISKVVNEYSVKWGIIDTVGKSRLYDEDEFVKYYIENGENSTYEKVNDELNSLRLIRNDNADKISKFYANYEMFLLKQMNVIKEQGCIKEYQIDYECANSIDPAFFQGDDDMEVLRNKDEADQIMDTLRKFFVQDLWTVWGVINVQ